MQPAALISSMYRLKRRPARGHEYYSLVDTLLCLELVDSTRKRNIKIPAYSSRTTRVLKGLDVVCFAQLKKKHGEKIRGSKGNGSLDLTHKYFLRTLGPVFLGPFTPKIVKTALLATRIHPFRQDAVLFENLGPSEALGTDSLDTR